jgi:hypothetical protein
VHQNGRSNSSNSNMLMRSRTVCYHVLHSMFARSRWAAPAHMCGVKPLRRRQRGASSTNRIVQRRAICDATLASRLHRAAGYYRQQGEHIFCDGALKHREMTGTGQLERTRRAAHAAPPRVFLIHRSTRCSQATRI